MNSVNDLLDKIKETRSLASDNALAGFLHTTRGSVSNWRLGKNYPDAVACARISEATGVPLAKVIGLVGEARAISREEKAVWHKLATAAALVLAVGLASAPVKAQATLSHFVITPSMSIMSTCAGWPLACCVTFSDCSTEGNAHMPICWHCKAEFSAAHHERIVYNKTPLYAEWSGWRMAGRYLVAPRGGRFTPERLSAIAWTDLAKKQIGRAGNVVQFRRSTGDSANPSGRSSG